MSFILNMNLKCRWDVFLQKWMFFLSQENEEGQRKELGTFLRLENVSTASIILEIFWEQITYAKTTASFHNIIISLNLL